MVIRVQPEPLAVRPTVSVVIPCYNYGRFLPGCVQSVLDQPGVDVDVLIVDDASGDDSAAVAHGLAASDQRVRVLQNPVNQGHITTYNEGLAAAEADYVVLLSADDLLAPGSLARSAALLEAHPEVGLVYGHSPTFTDRPPPAKTAVRSWSIWSGEEWIGLICRGVNNPVTTPDVMMRTKLMRELGGYDARLPHAADFLLWLRAAARAAIGRVNGADQAFYRVHGSNMHVEQYGGAWSDFVERVRTFDVFFGEDGSLLREPQRLHNLIRQSLAREALTIAAKSEVLAHYRDAPVEKLVSMARELAPPSGSSELWTEYQRRGARHGSVLVRAVRRLADVVADDMHRRIRWQRWRRSGLYSPRRSI